MSLAEGEVKGGFGLGRRTGSSARDSLPRWSGGNANSKADGGPSDHDGADSPTGVAVATPAAAATPVPEQAVAPALHPGKLTWMTDAWGNERFDYTFSVGRANNYARIMHGFPTATNEKLQLIPGIISRWEASSDGRTWTLTVRDGVKFHDGKRLTAEDLLFTWLHGWGPGALDKVTQAASQAQAQNTEKIEQTGPDKVSITTKIVDSGFAATLLSEAAGGWYGVIPKREKVFDDALEQAYDRNPVAAGPMKLVRHVPACWMSWTVSTSSLPGLRGFQRRHSGADLRWPDSSGTAQRLGGD